MNRVSQRPSPPKFVAGSVKKRPLPARPRCAPEGGDVLRGGSASTASRPIREKRLGPAAAKIAFRAFAGLLLWMAVASGSAAQDLAPRAYLITPVNSNAVILSYSYSSGALQFDGAVPVSGATADIHMPIFSFYHTLNFFGRSASVTVALPYGIGHFNGTVQQAPRYAYRSGLLDSYYRFSVNLMGGPAMNAREFAKWRQKRLLGVSLNVVAPTGQYDGTRLLNWGNNRWGFKPELGYSERWGHWLLDAYAAAWFFTTNEEFFSYNQYVPGLQTQSESPVVAFEGHLSYDVRPRLWISLDGNFWHGGETSLSGVENPVTLQKSSRVGVTLSVPLTPRQSLKVSFYDGAYINYGGNYKNASVGWQYGWTGWPAHSK